MYGAGYGIPNLYTWILVVGAINSFLDACGIGMNDMANSFGTIYGSKVLNKWQIVLLAACCEFTGALVLGKNVIGTISGGIARIDYFKYDPYCLMYGFLCALAASTIWTWLATYWKLPVSTTHAIVGGILGFSLVMGGKDAVNWYDTPNPPAFPYISGFSAIVVSWGTSPIFAGILAAIVYGFVKVVVLSGTNNGPKAAYVFPLFIFATFFIESFLICTKGAANRGGIDWNTDIPKVSWVSACVGFVGAVLSCGFIPPLLRGLKTEQERIAKGEEKLEGAHVVWDRNQMNCFQVAYFEFFRDPYFANTKEVEEEKKLVEVEGENPMHGKHKFTYLVFCFLFIVNFESFINYAI